MQAYHGEDPDCCNGGEMGLNCKYKNEGGFRAKKQDWVGISGRKITKRKYPGQRCSC